MYIHCKACNSKLNSHDLLIDTELCANCVSISNQLIHEQFPGGVPIDCIELKLKDEFVGFDNET